MENKMEQQRQINPRVKKVKQVDKLEEKKENLPSTKAFPCTIEGCTKSYTHKAHLNLHVKTHDPKNKHKCTFDGCNYETNYKGTLDIHLRSHTNEKPYKCDFPDCTAEFKQSAHLAVHKRRHTGDKKYKCPVDGCDYASVKKGGLDSHLDRHYENKKFICDYADCRIKCITKFDLKMHKLTHTEEKNITCDLCKATFKYKISLKYHQQTAHSDEKAFSCDFLDCKYACKAKILLECHKRIHEEVKRFKCTEETCDFVANQGHHLKSHIASWHTEEGQQKRKISEETVAKLLTKHDIDYKRESRVELAMCNNGTYARIDFIHIRNGVLFAIENDEDQHKEYPVMCEISRMLNVHSTWMTSGNTLPVVWIRFNPDGFKFDGKSIYTRLAKKHRIANVVKLIEKLSSTSKEALPEMQIWYCYYTMTAGKATIIDHKEFPNEFKEIVHTLQIDNDINKNESDSDDE
jgi:hypothetical protein